MAAPRLYSPAQAALAALLGSPLAGGYLLFSNFRRLEDRRAGLALGAGLAFTALLLLAGALLPDSVSRVLPVVGVVSCYQAARLWQGAQFEAHLAAQGARESSWKAAGVGLLFLLGLLLVLVPLAFVTGLGEPDALHFGKSAVLYERGATLGDAQKVGQALEKSLLASADGVEVRLRRTPELVVSFVLLNRGWESEPVVSSFETLRANLELSLGEKVTVELTDELLFSKRRLGPPR